jgi:hypothetical protein
MKKFIAVSILGCLLTIVSCEEQADKDNQTDNAKEKAEAKKEEIPLTRDAVSQKPVAEFVKKTDDPLNDWYFSVKLYETSKTFHYLIKLQFEEIRGEDTLKLPNLGTMPKPLIKPADEKYACIIGFMDKENQFREYKKVYVKNNSLKITALKHYAVRSY